MRVGLLDMDVDEALETIISFGAVVSAFAEEQTGESPFAGPGQSSAE